jgi:RNA polymerase sigma factor (sigma-70 family)
MQMQPFQVVAERYAGDVWRFCASQVGVAGADDCFQETMLAALEAYPRLRDPRAVRSWLLRVASRKAIDRHRRVARDAIPVADVEPGGGDRTPAREVGLLELVGQLPEKQRLAVAYRFVADLPYREIGELMDTSDEAARRNVHEGVKALRSLLTPRPRARNGPTLNQEPKVTGAKVTENQT